MSVKNHLYMIELKKDNLYLTLLSISFSVSLIELGPVATEFSSSVREKGIDGLGNGDEETKAVINKVILSFEKRRDQLTQTGDDVAKVIVKAMEDEKPHLHYITSEALKESVKRKYVDITGDSVVQMSMQRFFPSEK